MNVKIKQFDNRLKVQTPLGVGIEDAVRPSQPFNAARCLSRWAFLLREDVNHVSKQKNHKKPPI